MIEEVEEKIKRNPAWSEEFRRGYNNGYSAAENHYNSVLKDKLAGINTLGDLCGKTYTEMTKVRNIGRKSLQEIDSKMNEYGLRFKPEK